LGVRRANAELKGKKEIFLGKYWDPSSEQPLDKADLVFNTWVSQLTTLL